MITSRHETGKALFRKKVKAISMLDTDSEVLWQPRYGEQFVVISAFVRTRNHAGTNSDLPNILLDNGTDGQDIVAGVDVASAVEGAVQRLTVIGNLAFDNENPLRLKKPDAAGGSTVFDIDVIVLALAIHDIQS